MNPSLFDPFHSWEKRVYPSLLFPYIEGSMEKLTIIVFPLCGVVGQNSVYSTLFLPYFGGKKYKRVKIYPNPIQSVSRQTRAVESGSMNWRSSYWMLLPEKMNSSGTARLYLQAPYDVQDIVSVPNFAFPDLLYYWHFLKCFSQEDRSQDLVQCTVKLTSHTTTAI